MAAPARDVDTPRPLNLQKRFFRDLTCDAITSDNIDKYAPAEVECPKDQTWIRPADSLSPEEQSYLEKRRPLLEEKWVQRIKDVGLRAPPRLPVVGMALSGGGYRAMISGAGMAFQPNETAGSVGDLLGLSSYVSGLSGGSWAVSSFYANNGIPPTELANNTWDLSSNLVFPDHDIAEWLANLGCGVYGKNQKRFATQWTDYWGLALSDHLYPAEYHTDQNPNLRWSDIPRISSRVKKADLPWPIIIAVEREEGEKVVGDNSTIYEFTFAEFGAWQWGSKTRSQGAFAPVRNLGTNMDNGVPQDVSKCYENFDNAGFVAGTSSAIFSDTLMQKLKDKSWSELGLFGGPLDVGPDIVEDVLKIASDLGEDVAVYPNPFYKWTGQENPNGNNEKLTLLDGGLADENIPLEPLLQPERAVDAIFAFDNSADSPQKWPKGISLYTTYQKSLNLSQKYDIPETMPPVPPREDSSMMT